MTYAIFHRDQKKLVFYWHERKKHGSKIADFVSSLLGNDGFCDYDCMLEYLALEGFTPTCKDTYVKL